MKDTYIAIIFILISLLCFGSLSHIASERTLTGLESVLLQFLGVFMGFVGSFIFGRQKSIETAKEMVKPHAKSAFRRLLYLYTTVDRMSEIIEETSSQDVKIAKIEEIIYGQTITASNALADWEDLIPEEVEKLKGQLNALREGR